MEILTKSEASAQTLGVYGCISLLIGGVLLAVAMNGTYLFIPLAYAATASLLFSREAFRDLRQLAKLVPIIIISCTILWQEEYNLPSAIPSLTSSSYFSGFLIGSEMSARAIVMVLVVSVFMRTIRISELTRVFEKASRSESFSFVFGLALNIMPYLQRIAGDTLNAIKLRGGFQIKNLASSLKHLLSSTTLNALEKCQDISYAAEARAFGLARTRARSVQQSLPSPLRTDFALIVITAIVLAVSFALKM